MVLAINVIEVLGGLALLGMAVTYFVGEIREAKRAKGDR